MLRSAWLAVLPGLMLGASGFAAGSHLEDWRSTESIHGLYEIEQAARAFVAAENAHSNTDWTVAEPNLKTLIARRPSPVARCSVPLDARWGEIRLFAPDGRELTRKVVEVVCAKPVSGERWKVSLRTRQS